MRTRTLSLVVLVLLLASLSALGVHLLWPGGLGALLGQPDAAVEHTCPMVEHAHVLAPGPGACPECSMDLVPLQEADHAQAQPAPPAPKGRGYYCPMHPTYQSERPGQCPICHMDLVPMQDADAAPSKVPGHAIVRIPDAQRRRIGVRTTAVRRQAVASTIRAVGRVEVDETRLSAVTLKFAGWLEELMVNRTGQRVEQGDPLAVVYSPELLEAQRSYLLAAAAQRAAPEDPFARASLESASERLRLWDLRVEQIEQLRERNRAEPRITLFARSAGTVMRRQAVQGAFVEAGRELYELADLSTVWILADLYEHEIPRVHEGQTAKVTVAGVSGAAIETKVAHVYPYLDETTRTNRVRLEVPNPDGRLKPGMFGSVELHLELGEQLVVDRDAVMDTGTRKLVFVDLGDDRIEPREVTVLHRAGDLTVLAGGVEAGERVVAAGNFLVDSESRLKSALLGRDGDQPAGEHAGHKH